MFRLLFRTKNAKVRNPVRELKNVCEREREFRLANPYLILTEYEVNIGNKSRVKGRGEAEVFYEVFFPILTKYEVNIRFITTNSPYFKFQNNNLMNPGFMIAQPLHHHLLMQWQCCTRHRSTAQPLKQSNISSQYSPKEWNMQEYLTA